MPGLDGSAGASRAVDHDRLDPRFYRAVYPDLAHLSDRDARRHWNRVGSRESRIPNRSALLKALADACDSADDFDPAIYLALNPDLEAGGIRDLDAATHHYLATGRLELRPFRLGPADFDAWDDRFDMADGGDPAHAGEPRQGWRSLPWDRDQPFSTSTEIASAILGRTFDSAHDLPTHIREEQGDLAYVKSLVLSDEMHTVERNLATLDAADFVLAMFESLDGRLPNSFELDQLVTTIDYATQSRSRLILHHAAAALLARQAESSAEPPPQPTGSGVDSSTASRMSFELLGTGRMVTAKDWDARSRKLEQTDPASPPRRPRRVADSVARSSRTPMARPRVAVIASLYECEAYLTSFIENLCEQTIFDESEFCLVLTAPSSREESTLLDFAARHANVSVVIERERIGIYRAWNIAIESTTAPYITNANADDLRRWDSLEIQARSLDRHPWVDVAYQEVLYTLDRSMAWDQIEAMGFTTCLPHVTAGSLLKGVNAPHNAPMWRRTLHDEVGLFDDSFVSAGDYEFWVRCVSAGKTFLKTRDPHVAYFVNPRGLSTRPGGRGAAEAMEVLSRYRHLLDYGEMPSYATTPDPRSTPRSRAERVTEGAIAWAGQLRALEEHLSV